MSMPMSAEEGPIMRLEPERAAALVAERLRRSQRELPSLCGVPVPPELVGLPGISLLLDRLRELLRDGVNEPPAREAAEWEGLPAGLGRDWLVRRTLEELGIRCEATGALQDLKGFLIASPHGAEIVVSDRLGPDERLAVYVHLLAHALLEGTPEMPRTFFSRLEYVDGRAPPPPSGAARRAEMVADALAQAILSGRLDGAPEYAYRRRRTDGEARQARGLRPALGRLVLDFCHRASLALFWHSPKYQKLRLRPEVSFLAQRVQALVRVAYAC